MIIDAEQIVGSRLYHQTGSKDIVNKAQKRDKKYNIQGKEQEWISDEGYLILLTRCHIPVKQSSKYIWNMYEIYWYRKCFTDSVEFSQVSSATFSYRHTTSWR